MCLTRIQVFAHEVRCAQAGGISSDSEARDQDDLCHPSSRSRMLVAEAEEQVDAKEEEAKKETEGEERGGGGDEATVNGEASLADRLIERLQDDSVRECLQADSTSTGAEPPVDKADARAVVTLSVPHTRSSESPGGSISAGDVGADDGGEGDDSSVAGSRRDVGGGGDGHGEVIDVQKLEKGARHVSAAARSKRCVSAQCIQRVAAVAGVRVSMPYVDWAWTDQGIWWERRHKALPWTVCLRLAVHPKPCPHKTSLPLTCSTPLPPRALSRRVVLSGGAPSGGAPSGAVYGNPVSVAANRSATPTHRGQTCGQYSYSDATTRRVAARELYSQNPMRAAGAWAVVMCVCVYVCVCVCMRICADIPSRQADM